MGYFNVLNFNDCNLLWKYTKNNLFLLLLKNSLGFHFFRLVIFAMKFFFLSPIIIYKMWVIIGNKDYIILNFYTLKTFLKKCRKILVFEQFK